MRTCEARTLDQEGFHMATSAGACPNAGSTYVFDYILCAECAEEARRAQRWSRDDEETQRDVPVPAKRSGFLVLLPLRSGAVACSLAAIFLIVAATDGDPRWLGQMFGALVLGVFAIFLLDASERP